MSTLAALIDRAGERGHQWARSPRIFVDEKWVLEMLKNTLGINMDGLMELKDNITMEQGAKLVHVAKWVNLIDKFGQNYVSTKIWGDGAFPGTYTFGPTVNSKPLINLFITYRHCMPVISSKFAAFCSKYRIISQWVTCKEECHTRMK
jgi:hypothetical protein